VVPLGAEPDLLTIRIQSALSGSASMLAGSDAPTASSSTTQTSMVAPGLSPAAT
jgi:hypothetical protein